ncbi:unnamed protein product [Lepeophtheirus salmonis]|uniref:(salmon louse) hypothetical protein n=1 Tax=Lepeophtheirus salmonis TaxID=72036 RepID=A0A817FD40_LEPSM|nr:unnamed protein product [Lepeophtheirus salmonis]CAG9477493.1 unnamed protein product [Lepeophtheirus salmonis]
MSVNGMNCIFMAYSAPQCKNELSILWICDYQNNSTFCWDNINSYKKQSYQNTLNNYNENYTECHGCNNTRYLAPDCKNKRKASNYYAKVDHLEHKCLKKDKVQSSRNGLISKKR